MVWVHVLSVVSDPDDGTTSILECPGVDESVSDRLTFSIPHLSSVIMLQDMCEAEPRKKVYCTIIR